MVVLQYKGNDDGNNINKVGNTWCQKENGRLSLILYFDLLADKRVCDMFVINLTLYRTSCFMSSFSSHSFSLSDFFILTSHSVEVLLAWSLHLSSNSPSKVWATRCSPGIPAAPCSASNRNLANGGTPNGRKGRSSAVTLHLRVFRFSVYWRFCKVGQKC